MSYQVTKRVEFTSVVLDDVLVQDHHIPNIRALIVSDLGNAAKAFLTRQNGSRVIEIWGCNESQFLEALDRILA